MVTVALNGVLTDADTARIAPDDRGFTLGDGLFETIRADGKGLRRFDAHMARFRQGAKVLDIPVPVTDTALAAQIAEVMAANDLAEAAVRVTLSRGGGARGIVPPAAPSPTLLITAAPLPPAPEPAAVIIAAATRRNEHSPLAGIKSLNYLDNILARREAAIQNADDALLLNTAGRVAESTVANLFILTGGQLITPPLSEGALPGVVRADIIARFRGEEGVITLDTLGAASEAFLTNSLGVRPVISIAGRPVGDGAPGLITQLLAARL